jgi:hypothetical protein
MIGFPKHLNTKEDYLYVAAHFPKEQTVPYFQNLLDTMTDWFFVAPLAEDEVGVEDATHKVVVLVDNFTQTEQKAQFELRTNPECKLLNLGFTVEEVQGFINE